MARRTFLCCPKSYKVLGTNSHFSEKFHIFTHFMKDQKIDKLIAKTSLHCSLQSLYCNIQTYKFVCKLDVTLFVCVSVPQNAGKLIRRKGKFVLISKLRQKLQKIELIVSTFLQCMVATFSTIKEI